VWAQALGRHIESQARRRVDNAIHAALGATATDPIPEPPAWQPPDGQQILGAVDLDISLEGLIRPFVDLNHRKALKS
jgi:hypothetical protein